MNCTSLTKSSDIFAKILQHIQPRKKICGSTTALKHIQNLYTQDGVLGKRMMLLIIDELDYLITKDREVLHELFMLTTLPFSKCVLIGIANAIDLADRFLPRLQSLKCKPSVLTFRAYSKDQIQKILQDRLAALPYMVFQPQSLELCARKVAAGSGDMRKALSVCRSAIEMLEAEIKEDASNLNKLSIENESDQENVPATPIAREIDINFDLATMNIEDMDFTSKIELQLKSSSISETTDKKYGLTWCYGVVLWFDTGFTSRFCREMPANLSTSPYTMKTHWSQTIFTFREPIALSSEKLDAKRSAAIGTDSCPASKIDLRISIARAPQHRAIDISMETSAVSHDCQRRAWPVQIFNLS